VTAHGGRIPFRGPFVQKAGIPGVDSLQMATLAGRVGTEALGKPPGQLLDAAIIEGLLTGSAENLAT
jgi:hypothetical protein